MTRPRREAPEITTAAMLPRPEKRSSPLAGEISAIATAAPRVLRKRR